MQLFKESFFDMNYDVDQFKVKYAISNKLMDAKIVLVPLPKGETFFIYMDKAEVWHDQDPHIFTSFCKLRKHLEAQEKMLLCVGCKINVHPSGGLMHSVFALQLSMNTRVGIKKDVVMIFDEELDITKLATVNQQEEFYRGWLDSIKGLKY